jgi:uncharacterized protein (DUF433 family)
MYLYEGDFFDHAESGSGIIRMPPNTAKPGSALTTFFTGVMTLTVAISAPSLSTAAVTRGFPAMTTMGEREVVKLREVVVKVPGLAMGRLPPPLLEATMKPEDFIVHDPGICGGSARIAGTRVPIWTLVEAKNAGASDKQLLEFFPRLTAAKLSAAWSYAEKHSDEIAKDLREQDEAEEDA